MLGPSTPSHMSHRRSCVPASHPHAQAAPSQACRRHHFPILHPTLHPATRSQLPPHLPIHLPPRDPHSWALDNVIHSKNPSCAATMATIRGDPRWSANNAMSSSFDGTSGYLYWQGSNSSMNGPGTGVQVRACECG